MVLISLMVVMVVLSGGGVDGADISGGGVDGADLSHGGDADLSVVLLMLRRRNADLSVLILLMVLRSD